MPRPGRFLLAPRIRGPARLAAALLVAAAGARADGGDPHLDPSPRTPAERERVEAATAPPEDFARPQPFERRPGGAATDFHVPSRDSFSHPSANMSAARRMDFLIGDGMFRRLWTTAPSSTRSSDGLGPLYNERSCQRCHRKDGRGRPPDGDGDRDANLVLRLRHADGGGDPVYGAQLQDRAVPGEAAEGRVRVSFTEVEAALAGGESVTLRRPRYGVAGLAAGPLDPGTALSPRVAPPMIGAGLLEAVPEADILARADPGDADGDGISGRARWLAAADGGAPVLGRFGWKAGAPTVRAQAASAFLEDIGIGTPDLPRAAGGCTEAQRSCLARPGGDAPRGDGVEIGEEAFGRLVFYARNLAVPARRGAGDPEVLRGKELFHGAGCAACHAPAFVTHRLPGSPERSFQLVWPYTDLLLHDMGEGLADGGPAGDPLRREWRTPPLWGIGLTEAVSGHFRLLHDGRADGLLEAVLWHGGEAAAARDAVAAMAPAERAALLAFLRSL